MTGVADKVDSVFEVFRDVKLQETQHIVLSQVNQIIFDSHFKL